VALEEEVGAQGLIRFPCGLDGAEPFLLFILPEFILAGLLAGLDVEFPGFGGEVQRAVAAVLRLLTAFAVAGGWERNATGVGGHQG